MQLKVDDLRGQEIKMLLEELCATNKAEIKSSFLSMMSALLE
jgi:hypothetical protein